MNENYKILLNEKEVALPKPVKTKEGSLLIPLKDYALAMGTSG